jgi:hypothetical protein
VWHTVASLGLQWLSSTKVLCSSTGGAAMAELHQSAVQLHRRSCTKCSTGDSARWRWQYTHKHTQCCCRSQTDTCSTGCKQILLGNIPSRAPAAAYTVCDLVGYKVGVFNRASTLSLRDQARISQKVTPITEVGAAKHPCVHACRKQYCSCKDY